jgi:hypothetical protein
VIKFQFICIVAVTQPPINSSISPKGVLRKGREKKRMKKVQSQAKGVGTFSFWKGFEAGIHSKQRQTCLLP